MLATLPNERPTALQLLHKFIPQSLHTSLGNPQKTITSSSFGIPSTIAESFVGTTLVHSPVHSPSVHSPMEWTRTGSPGVFQKFLQPTPTIDSMQESQPKSTKFKRRRQSCTHANFVYCPNDIRKRARNQAVSRNGRQAKSQSERISKQPLSNWRRRSKSKGTLSKMQDIIAVEHNLKTCSKSRRRETY
jgi:hypothetical protein